MRSKDLINWTEPELIKVKGPDTAIDQMGRMIDPYLLKDKDEKNKWWCFYKQNGASFPTLTILKLGLILGIQNRAKMHAF